MSIKPTVIVCQPYGIEYPFWRYQMEKYRKYFADILIGCYNDNRPYNFMEFLKGVTPWGTIVDSGTVRSGDWRNWSTNPCVDRVKSEWILFLEQDFVPEEGFYEELLNNPKEFDIAGFADKAVTTSLQGGVGNWSFGVRSHPAFILVRTELVNRTMKDFGAHPEPHINRDHFGVFSDELFNMKPQPRYFDLDVEMPGKWKHYAGVYSNYMLILRNEPPNYKPAEFYDYVRMAMTAPVQQDPRFLEWSNKCLTYEANR